MSTTSCSAAGVRALESTWRFRAAALHEKLKAFAAAH